MSTKKSSPQSAKGIHVQAHTKHVVSHHASVIRHAQEEGTSLREKIDVTNILPVDVHEMILVDGSVEEIRDLHTRVYLKPRGDVALFIVTCPTLSLQAQNALLKLLEDPPQYARIVLGVPVPRVLLETVRSRVHILEEDVTTKPVTDVTPKMLLSASYPQRLVIVESLIEEKNIEKICSLIEDTAQYIQMEYADSYAVILDQTKSAVTTIEYLRMQGSMVKMLVEAWVLTLPDAR